MSEWWLWSYVVVMAGGVLWFMRWSRDAKGIPQVAYWLVIVILLWSGGWHVVMVLGGGQVEVAGHKVHWAHYTDWVATAPLLVIALVLTATHGVAKKRPGLMVTLVVTVILMILSGLVAELMVSRTAHFTVYGVGMVAFAVAAGLIWGPLRNAAKRQPAAMASHFKLTALLLCVLWLGFPLVWILGPPGVGIFGDLTSTALFVVLSVLMKVAWSVFDIARLRALSDRGQLFVP